MLLFNYCQFDECRWHAKVPKSIDIVALLKSGSVTFLMLCTLMECYNMNKQCTVQWKCIMINKLHCIQFCAPEVIWDSFFYKQLWHDGLRSEVWQYSWRFNRILQLVMFTNRKFYNISEINDSVTCKIRILFVKLQRKWEAFIMFFDANAIRHEWMFNDGIAWQIAS